MSDQNTNFRPRREFSYPLVSLSVSEKMQLNRCIIEELNFYNSLVENFSAVYNRSPELLASIDDEQTILFGNLCANGMASNTARYSPLFEGQKEVLKELPESISIIFEISKRQVGIIKDTKKQMAIEVLKFFTNQAKNKKEKRVGSAEQEYKSNMNTLEKYSPMQKRHLQIRRAVCEIVYEEKENRSTLIVPYIKRPIAVVEDTDLNKSTWSLAIIHQQPGTVPKADSEWIVDFKSIGYGYMLKYLDKKYHK